MTPEQVETWAVVCQDFHKVVGPFLSAEDALRVAVSMTGERGCVYVPVQMDFVGGEILRFSSEEEMREAFDSVRDKKDVEYKGGQYL